MQKYEQNLTANSSGALRPLAGASVTVTDNANGLPAALYSDNGVTPLPQPLTTDGTGYFGFYAADGKYTLTFSGPRFSTFTREILLEDPADNPYATLAGLRTPGGSGEIGHLPDGVGAAPTTTQAAIRQLHADVYRANKYPRPARSNKGILRWHGNGGGSIGALSDAVTYGIKIEAEADFDAVALLWVNHESTAVNNCKAVVAATETFLTDTQDRRYRPVVGGTVYNTLRGASAPYGWDAVTWGGAPTVNIPSAGGAAAPQVVVSDFMPISSVPRADGGARPLLLIRAYHNGATDGAYTYESRNYNASYNAATPDNRGRLIDTSVFAGDAVGTLANAMLIGTKSFLLAPIFRFRHNTVTVASVGDSISAGTGSAGGLSSWNRRACYDLSTPLAPVIPMNMGYASQPTATYLGAARVILAAARPTIAFYFPYSPNDAISTSQRKVMDAMARCADFIDFCNANSIVPIIATPVPNNNLTEAEDALRKAIASAVVAMGAARDVVVADFGAVTGDGATPERWRAGLSSDALHPSDAGHEAMAVAAKAAISTVLANY